MRALHVHIAGADRPVYVWESPEDSAALLEWARLQAGRPIAVDVETTGLDPYAPGFRIRTVQLGSTESSWTIPYELGGLEDLVRASLALAGLLLAHNASYDLQVLAHAGLLDLDEAWSRTVDTRILAHLLDPRGKNEGGTGMVLEDVSARYFGDGAQQYKSALLDLFKANKWAKGTGYAKVDLWAPEFLRYGATDVILTSWLFDALVPLVRTRFQRLSAFEHEVARVISGIERRGLLVDRPYAETLVTEYAALEAEARRTAATYGIEKLGSPKVVPEVLEALGAELVERTPTGRPKVDKAVLQALIDNHEGTPLAEVAGAILVGKNARKWSVSYVESTLDRLDPAGRVHPSIKALEARTARMSVSTPPLQQLPSGDWRVRRMFVPDPGFSIFAVDYSQVELRILAALAREPTMLRAIADGKDLHDTTAELLYGPDFTKAQRKLSKNTNFGTVYGGGAAVLARQAGVSLSVAREARDGFRAAYPAIGRYGRRLQEEAQWGRSAVTTPSGRVLPLDRDRTYAAVNYVVQSTARDVLAEALLNLEKAGLGDFMLLPVHDEVVGQAPTEDVEEVCREVANVMSVDFLGRVHLEAEGDVYGPSWGHGYGAVA